MSDQPPELIEAVSQSPSGETWRARQADGTPVLAVKLPSRDESTRTAALERLRQLARLKDPNLATPLGWWQDGDGVWLVLAAEQGEAFLELPSAGFLSPQQASVISLAVLEGLQALHREGLLHGALAPDSVRVLPDGRVRLSGHQLAGLSMAPAPGELAAELRQAGLIVCQAFGIPPQRNPREAPRAVEHAAPALVSTARTIAAGGTGADAGLALQSFRETAGPLARPARLDLGREELAALVKARRGDGQAAQEIRFRGLPAPILPSAPAAAPAAEPDPAPPSPAARPAAVAAAAPRPTWSERHAPSRPLPHDYDEPGGGRLGLIAGGLVAVLVIAALAFFGARSFLAGSSGSRNQPSNPPATGASQTSAPPRPSASPLPAPVPSFGPASSGTLQGIDLKLTSSSCSPGQICSFETDFHIQSAPAHQITWTFKLFDRCTYTTTDAGGGTFSTQNGWTLAIPADTQVQVPSSKGQVAVVAVGSNQGDSAASPALMVGTASSCT